MLRAKLMRICAFLMLAVVHSSLTADDRYLYLPDPIKCKNRPQGSTYEGVNFFYSGHVPELADLKVDWLDARNTCRERCMETVTFDVEKKFDFFKKYIMSNDIKFIWTSGRLCDFAGCEGRWDLLPKIIKAWLWTANQAQMPPTNMKPPDWTYQPWSQTGHRKLPQPDDAEFFINQIHEGCLAVLNNMYNDSVTFHDVGCHHKTRFICEDSVELIEQSKMIEAEQAEEKVRKAAEDATRKPEIVEVTTKDNRPRPTFTSRSKETTKGPENITTAPRTKKEPKITTTTKLITTTTIVPESVESQPEEDYYDDETTSSP